MNRRVFPALLGISIFLAFALGLTRLFVLRFQAGDVYPPYSSLRADPLGTKAFHDALERLPGFTVERRYRPLNNFHVAEQQTHLMIGIRPETGGMRRDVAEMKRLAAAGHRVILAFRAIDHEEENPKHAQSDKPIQAGDLSSLLQEELGVAFDYFTTMSERSARTTVPALETLKFISELHFTNLTDDWTTIHLAEGQPVVIERRYGDGSLALIADAYSLSNEALRQDRPAEFLAWLIGPGRHAVFHEIHHGLSANPSVMGLMRNYNLTPLLLALLVLIGLFLWRNALPLAPRRPRASGANEGPAVLGHDAATGRINLLRRAVPAAELSSTCVELWERSFGRRMKQRPQTLELVRAAVEREKSQPARRRDPLATYREIAAVLNEKP